MESFLKCFYLSIFLNFLLYIGAVNNVVIVSGTQQTQPY